MNTLLPCTFALAIAAAALPASAPAQASSNIQRCIAPDGATVYTDQACGRLGANALPLPAELLARIVEDRATERRHDPLVGTVDASRPLDIGTIPAGRRSPDSGCAKDPTQLAADLRGALALGDVNRVAESYHWAGMSAKAGRHVMDRLQDLSAKQVVDSRYYRGARGSFSDDAGLIASAPGGQDLRGAGFLQLVLDVHEARSVIDFDVNRYRGCYFVSF
jgi:hypothetical protein